jgi:predicted HAD superfamily hydrolase
MANLQNRIDLAIDKHDVIAFDVFDTLLVRPYNNPGDMFIHLEKIHKLDGFAAVRGNAELCARKKTKHEEITYDEIYAQIDVAFKCMYEHEVEFEKLILRANPDIQKYFQYAVRQKKTVIIISDMYLPKSVIEYILISNNYGSYDKIYLSSDCLLTKHTGNLFSFVLKDMNISGRNLLHIGDNYYSDFFMARKNGIHAYHYTKIKWRLFHQVKNAGKYRAKNARSLGASIILGSLAFQHIKQPVSGRSYFENFGYTYGGPAVFAYMEWLKNKLRAEGITSVLFVARDGYILKKVFDLINGGSFHTAYVYAPRIINILFLMDCDSGSFFESIGLPGIKKILHFYKNKDISLRSITPPDDDLTFYAAKEFIQKNISLYKVLAEKEKDAYYRCVASGIHGKKIAVVDSITERYSAQKLMRELFARDGISVSGYYWSVLSDTATNGGGGGVKEFRHENEPLAYNLSLIEFLMSSPETPIEYVENGLPVYKELSDNERMRIETYPAIAAGIINYAKDIISVFGGNDVFISYKDTKDWLNIFIDFPSSADKEQWRNLKRAASFDHDSYTMIFSEWYEKKMIIAKKLLRRLVYSSPNMFRKCLAVLNAIGRFRKANQVQ